MKYLFLDDERQTGDVTWMLIGGVGAGAAPWQTVRSYNEATAWVIEHGFPTIVSFDHDLGYEEYDTNENGIVIVTNSTEAKSGYDFAKWLIEYDMNTNTMPVNFAFTVHSMNPVGKKNIEALLNSYIKHRFKN